MLAIHQKRMNQRFTNPGCKAPEYFRLPLSLIKQIPVKQFIPALFVISLFAASCSKPDDTPVVKNNTWVLGGTTYTVNNYVKTTDDFQAHDKSGNKIFLSFNPFPTADGNYTVVNNSATLGANEVKVLAAGSASGASYFATGFDHTTATIKVLSPTLLRVTLPDTWVVKGGTDSLKLSINVGEL
jgi:hypothetical protein